MSKLICAIDDEDILVEGSVGFFKQVQLAERFPDATIVELENKSFPKKFRADHFIVIEKNGEHSLKKKTKAEIDAIPEEVVEVTTATQALKDIDMNSASDEMKVVVAYLKQFLPE